jgi:hypothetical protein
MEQEHTGSTHCLQYCTTDPMHCIAGRRGPAHGATEMPCSQAAAQAGQ